MQVLGMESQLVRLRFRLRIESQPAGCRFWDWNHNLEVNRNLCGLQAFGTGIATCRLRIESQPAGCRFWDWNRNLEVNRNLQVAGFWDWNRNPQVATQFATCGVQVANWIATCGMQVLGMESQLVRLRFRLRIESQPAGCRFWDWNHNLEVNRNLCGLQAFGTGIATCRLRIESQPAGCRFWDWNRNFDSNRNLWVAGFINRRDRKWSASQLAGWELNRNLRDAGFGIGIATSKWIATCRLQAFGTGIATCRLRIESRTCGVQVANWIATCGMQGLGLESQLAGCELNRNLRDAGFGTGIATSTRITTCGLQAYRRDCNRNLQVANWIATLRSAGCELNCNLRDAGFGTGIAARRLRLNSQPAEGWIESQPAGCRFWAWNRNLQVANWIATLRSAGCELNRNLRDAGFGTGITTSKWIATCVGCRLLGLESQFAGCELNRNLRDAGFRTGIATCRLRIESQPCGVQVANWIATCRNLRVVGFGTWIAYWGGQVIRHIHTWSYMIVRQVHFASPLPFPLLKGSTRAGYQTSFGGEIEFQWWSRAMDFVVRGHALHLVAVWSRATDLV